MAEANKHDDVNGTSKDMTGKFNTDPSSDSDGEEQTDVVDEGYAEEYQSVNNALDEISAFMDVLEERNEHLLTKLQELIEDSRKTNAEADQDKTSDDSSRRDDDSHDQQSTPQS